MIREAINTRNNLDALMERINEIYQYTLTEEFSYVEGWPEFDIVRNNLDEARSATNNLLRDVEEDLQNNATNA